MNPFVQLRVACYLLVLVAVSAIPFALAQRKDTKPEPPTKLSQRILTFEERVSYQRAIEDVYWRHRIWPKENLNSKPSLDAVMSQGQLEKKVTDYLRKSQALEDSWKKPITAEQLQAEMDRMAENTKQPQMLRELFDALGNDPFVVAECLARPVLTGRLILSLDAMQIEAAVLRPTVIAVGSANYRLPKISEGAGDCTNDTWTPTDLTNAPRGRWYHTAVWTGTEMIVWGGWSSSGDLNTGGRYNPSTDSWTNTRTVNAPEARRLHTAVWTGSEMIVWGGTDDVNDLNTGGRYNPSTDSWTGTSTTNAPEARAGHTAVWTGSEMIVWGGDAEPCLPNCVIFNTGGRYNPSTDSWTATSTTNAPAARGAQTAVWTSSEMIVWGGTPDGIFGLNTGGRYNPSTDSWTGTSTTNAPEARAGHTAVWTGSEMIVWGGGQGTDLFNTGGRYNPSTDTWIATSTTNAPEARVGHTAVWTDSEMIVWGGTGHVTFSLNTGGRYNPSNNTWTATSTSNAPVGRQLHTAVWTDSEMIVWGGEGASGALATGGRYCAQSGAPTPTPTPTATATATPTATSSPTPTPTPCMGRCAPTPRPRPTPAPRP